MGQWRVVAEIPATPLGPAAARRVVDGLLRGWHLERFAADAQLIASELVTNAVQHAPGPDRVNLELVCHSDRLRICLADASTAGPVLAEPDPADPSGRGLRIVQAVAARWGAEEHRGGKQVWAELPLTDHTD